MRYGLCRFLIDAGKCTEISLPYPPTMYSKYCAIQSYFFLLKQIHVPRAVHDLARASFAIILLLLPTESNIHTMRIEYNAHAFITTVSSIYSNRFQLSDKVFSPTIYEIFDRRSPSFLYTRFLQQKKTRPWSKNIHILPIIYTFRNTRLKKMILKIFKIR